MATESTPIKAAQAATKSAPVTPDTAKPVGEPKPAHTPEKKADAASEPARKQ